MSQIDAGRERERLAGVYASMSDGELEKVGRDPAALTEWAREALQQEMKRRNIEWPVAQEPALQAESGEEEEANRLVILKSYRDMPGALIEKGLLENAGITCFLQDDNVVRMDWLWSNAIGGVKLLVPRGQLDEAAALLEEYPEELDADEPIEGQPEK
jgi:hypothetical protein